LQPGVEMRRLFKHMHSGYEVALVRYRAGASVPMHRHVADEHVYVLEGSQRDERGRYPAGSYVFNAAGSSHGVSSDEGCLALVHWLAPVQFI
jgi:anti-sigma factor ChrR (cupin superfamily)